MNTVEFAVKTITKFSEDYTERYLLRRILNTEKDDKRAVIITIYPASAEAQIYDLTSCLIQNAMFSLGFTSYDAVNICSKINPESKEIGESVSAENIEQIKLSTEEVAKQESGSIIVAWGSAGTGSKSIQRKQMEILKILKPFENKVFMISDGRNVNLHPLVPSLRSGKWILEKFDFPELQSVKKDDTGDGESTGKKKRKNSKKPIQVGKESQLPEQSQNENAEGESPEQSEQAEQAQNQEETLTKESA